MLFRPTCSGIAAIRAPERVQIFPRIGFCQHEPTPPVWVCRQSWKDGFFFDSDYVSPWAEKIGQFILNFGGIEFVTHKFLVLLEPDETKLEAHFGLLLQARIGRILELLANATHLPSGGRDLAERDWNEIKKMCLWRNHIAHNPVLPYWDRDKNLALDPPDGITMPDLRQFKDGGGVHLDLRTLSKLVEVSANLSRRLVETANFFRNLSAAADPSAERSD